MTAPQNPAEIQFRRIEQTEAYLPGTGLAVWEVAWIADGYGGDLEATARHLGIDCGQVRAALEYAANHHEEIAVQIHNHVSWTVDEVRRAFPRVRMVSFDAETGALDLP